MRKRAASPSANEHVVDDEWLDVGLRRAPRAGRFLLLGIVAGVVVAIIFTAIAQASGQGAANFGLEGLLRVFALFFLVFVGIGLAVAGGLVILLERLATRRAKKSLADRETVLYYDLTKPASDEPPRRDR